MIYLTLTQSFQTAQLETISNLDVIDNFFEILKYYIGATVVELIGMLPFVFLRVGGKLHFRSLTAAV